MVGEKTPVLGRTFRLDTSAGFGKGASMRFRAPSLRPSPLHDRPNERPAWGTSTPTDDSTDPEPR
jgi:hypothetical protein